MERLSIPSLILITDELNVRIKAVAARLNEYDTPGGFPVCGYDYIPPPTELTDELLMLNDEFNSYQRRLLHLQGRQVEKQALLPIQPTDKRRTDTGLYFITISPPFDSTPMLSLPDFVSAVRTFCLLKVVKSYTYCFEQRSKSETEPFRGYHSHILCERNTKPYAFKKELKRVFSKFFSGDFLNTPFFKVENVENTENQKRIRYISGDKYGKTKAKKVSRDKVWRITVGLQDIYKSD